MQFHNEISLDKIGEVWYNRNSLRRRRAQAIVNSEKCTKIKNFFVQYAQWKKSPISWGLLEMYIYAILEFSTN